METTINILIGICIVLIILIAIVLILYFRNTPEKYSKTPKKKNKVDEEIEKELRKKR